MGHGVRYWYNEWRSLRRKFWELKRRMEDDKNDNGDGEETKKRKYDSASADSFEDPEFDPSNQVDDDSESSTANVQNNLSRKKIFNTRNTRKFNQTVQIAPQRHEAFKPTAQGATEDKHVAKKQRVAENNAAKTPSKQDFGGSAAESSSDSSDASSSEADSGPDDEFLQPSSTGVSLELPGSEPDRPDDASSEGESTSDSDSEAQGVSDAHHGVTSPRPHQHVVEGQNEENSSSNSDSSSEDSSSEDGEEMQTLQDPNTMHKFKGKGLERPPRNDSCDKSTQTIGDGSSSSNPGKAPTNQQASSNSTGEQQLFSYTEVLPPRHVREFLGPGGKIGEGLPPHRKIAARLSIAKTPFVDVFFSPSEQLSFPNRFRDVDRIMQKIQERTRTTNNSFIYHFALSDFAYAPNMCNATKWLWLAFDSMYLNYTQNPINCTWLRERLLHAYEEGQVEEGYDPRRTREEMNLELAPIVLVNKNLFKETHGCEFWHRFQNVTVIVNQRPHQPGTEYKIR